MSAKKLWVIPSIIILIPESLVFSEFIREPRYTNINESYGYSFTVLCMELGTVEAFNWNRENFVSEFFQLQSNSIKYTLIGTESDCLPPKMKPFLTLTVINDYNNIDNDNNTYYCKVSATGFQKKERDSKIYIQNLPTSLSSYFKFGIIEHSVRFKCVVFSIPPPGHVLWSLNDVTIDSSNTNYLISKNLFSYGIESILTIRKIECQNYGHYRCIVKNYNDVISRAKNYNNVDSEIIINTSKYYVLVFLSLVLLVLVVVLVFVIRQRSKSKNPVAYANDQKEIDKTWEMLVKSSESPEPVFLSKDDKYSQNYNLEEPVANGQKDLKPYFLSSGMYSKYSASSDMLSKISKPHYASLPRVKRANEKPSKNVRSLRRSHSFKE